MPHLVAAPSVDKQRVELGLDALFATHGFGFVEKELALASFQTRPFFGAFRQTTACDILFLSSVSDEDGNVAFDAIDNVIGISHESLLYAAFANESPSHSIVIEP